MYYPSIQDIQIIIERLNKRHGINATIMCEGQLKFILEKPRMQIYCSELYPELYQKAAALMEGLTKAHTLTDGNKRCAMNVAEYMIKVNGAELVLPLKTIRLSVDTAEDGEDKMSKEIQQWFKVHTANNMDQLSILLEEIVEEESIIRNLLDQKKLKEADELLDKWVAFDSYPEHRTAWIQQKKKLANQDTIKQKNNQARKFTVRGMLMDISQYNLKHPSHSNTVNIRSVSDLSIVDHTLEELVLYEKTIKRREKRLANTKDIRLLFSKAHILEQTGKSEEALELYEQILELDPTYDHAYIHIGLIHWSNLDYQKSVVNFRKCIELNPADPYAYYMAASGLNILDRNEEALKEINGSIKIEPEEPRFHYAKSIVQASLKDLDGAEESIKKALKKKPVDPEYLTTLGRILTDNGRYGDALKACQKAVNIEPESMTRVHHLAHVHYAMGNYDEAIKCHDRILQTEPDNLEVLIDIGGAHSNKGEYKKALQHLKMGLAIDAKHKIGLNSMGITLAKMGKYDEAMKYVDQSIELDKGSPDPVITKSVILVKQNKIDYALELIKKITKKHPDTKKVICNMPEFAGIRDSELFKKLIG